MGLSIHALRSLRPYLKNASVLSLGYPDILASREECEDLFAVVLNETMDVPTMHRVKGPLVETTELMKALGSKFECIDVVNWRGFEKILDLNYPHELGSFDLVIDPGTTEHCFNIGQAMLNAANAVKVGGRIYHSHPMTMLNHGFYNVCPTMVQDFYTQNGWTIEVLEARIGESFVPITEAGAMARKVTVSNEAGLISIARRNNGAPMQFPLQRRYQIAQERLAA